jgi:hypothetical protein
MFQEINFVEEKQKDLVNLVVNTINRTSKQSHDYAVIEFLKLDPLFCIQIFIFCFVLHFPVEKRRKN